MPLLSPKPRRLRAALLLPAVAVLALVGGCGEPTDSPPGTLNVVALGDSLALGVQPQLLGSDRETSQGYPRLLARQLREQGRSVKLHELGCGGATSASVINGGLACAPERDTPYDNEDPSTSQLAYAEGLLSTLSDRPTVVVLDIGGNDVGSCLKGGTIQASCVANAGRKLRTNLTTILARLRAVAPTTPIAVLDLYDPFLGLWETHPEGRVTLARIHAVFLRDVNRTIATVAASGGARLGELGRAMQQNAPLSPTQTTVPAAVTEVCRLSWMCVDPPLVPNIHLRRDGYAVAATVLERALAPDLGTMGR